MILDVSEYNSPKTSEIVQTEERQAGRWRKTRAPFLGSVPSSICYLGSSTGEGNSNTANTIFSYGAGMPRILWVSKLHDMIRFFHGAGMPHILWVSKLHNMIRFSYGAGMPHVLSSPYPQRAVTLVAIAVLLGPLGRMLPLLDTVSFVRGDEMATIFQGTMA